MTDLVTIQHIPTAVEAREDPAHRPWFVLVDAVEAVRREPCERTREALQRAHEALQRALNGPAEREAAE